VTLGEVLARHPVKVGAVADEVLDGEEEPVGAGSVEAPLGVVDFLRVVVLDLQLLSGPPLDAQLNVELVT
jgi:hypothetical protein